MYLSHMNNTQNFGLLSFILCISCVLKGQSVEIESLSPLPMRTSNNAVVEGFINGDPYVYSFGGIDETLVHTGIHSRAFRLDVNANAWEEIAPLPDTRPKIASSASRVDDIIYIIGGYHVAANGSEESSAKVHRYDILNNVYLEDGEDIPIAIDDQVQVVNGPLIYVVSGWNDNNNVQDVQVYDTRSDSWAMATPVPSGNLYRCFGCSGVLIEDKIIYYGGAQGFGFPSRKELRVGTLSPDDPLEITWSLMTPDESPNSYRNAAAVIEGQPVWIGGSETSYNFDGIAYNGSGGVGPAGKILLNDSDGAAPWSEIAAEVPMDLRSAGSLTSESVVIAGGMKAGQEVTDETLLLRFSFLPSSTEESLSPAGFEVTPTVTTGQTTIHFQNTPEKKGPLKVINMQGQLVRSYLPEHRSMNLDLSGLEAGTYLLIHAREVRQLIIID